MKNEIRRFLFSVEMVLISTFINLISAQSSSVNDLALKIPPRPEISGGAAMILSKVKGSAQQISDVEVPLIPDFLGYLSPNILVSFDAINFDGDHTNTAHYHIPPDPIGAAGLNHVVNVVNTSIEWYTKTGSNQNSQSLSEFFSSLAPLTDNTFDPKVIYDQYADRFVAVALEMTDTTSRIMLAVSDDSDPNGIWYYHAINSKLIADGDTSWADYPGLALDQDAIYITSNMYTFDSSSYRASFLWIVEKGMGSGGFYDGGSAIVSTHDPYAATGGYAMTTQPSHMFGIAPSGVGTFLVSYFLTLGGSGGLEYAQVIRVDNPLGNIPVFNYQQVPVGDIEDLGGSFGFPPLLDAPQSGTTQEVEVNDRRALHSVWRDNSLWITTTITPNYGSDAGQTTAHWFRINTSNLTLLELADQGNVGGEDIATGTFTFFPSIAVNMNGDMGIGFAACGPDTFPGAYYTWHKAGDLASTVQPTQTLRAGVDYYYRAFGGSKNRWGDYSGISVDPSDDVTFWVFNEYAMSRGSILLQHPTEDGRWATVWGSFTTNPVSVGEQDNLISEFTLYQNYPNPFNPTTNIRFEISDQEFVELKIYDINGRLVQTLLRESKAPGNYEVQWDGRDSYGKEVSSGAFFYQIKAGDLVQTKKMLLMR